MAGLKQPTIENHVLMTYKLYSLMVLNAGSNDASSLLAGRRMSRAAPAMVGTVANPATLREMP